MNERASIRWTTRAAWLGVAAISACAPAPTAFPAPFAPPRSPPGVVPRATVLGPAEHPRFLFTPERIAALRRGAAAGTYAYRRTLANCEEDAAKPIKAGYEAWSWAHAIGSLSTCFYATGETRFRSAAVGYLAAMLDDRYIVGDRKGGEHVVEHGEGYAIRTFGFFTALGFDWLHDAPEMRALTAKVALRLDAWTSFYRREGYLREQPIANHFIGYFLATAGAGIALEGESEGAREELRHAREDLFDGLIAPAYKRSLAGGDWPESWQYGDLVLFGMALYADAERRTPGGRDVYATLPWLREAVRAHVHALLPDGVHAYDGGDWSDKPARMPTAGLWALSTLLPDGDPVREDALGLARGIGGELHEEAWLMAIADDPRVRASDPRHGTPSLFLPGTGLTFARSDWSKGAVFVSMQSGPTVTPDHQHSDQGHISIVRGGDALLVDSGEYGSASTMSHNTILVDDGGDALRYAPNQGRWGTASRTTRFFDAGEYVTARGDFGDAYRPEPDSGRTASVRAALRDLVFLRPDFVIVRDRITVSKGSYGVTWVAHGEGAPSIEGGDRVRFANGGSRAALTILDPPGATPRIVAEPSPSGQGPWFMNQPTHAPSSRLEVSSPKGGHERGFLVVFDVADAAMPRRPVSPAPSSDGVVSALLPPGPDGPRLVAFAEDDHVKGEVTIVGPSRRADLVIGLVAGGGYSLETEPRTADCQVTLRFVGREGAHVATDGGTLAYSLERCALR